jgi:hypothetical protein
MALKKGQKKESQAPVLDIPVARLKIVECELFEEPQEIETNDGRTFTAEPHFNTRLEIVDDFGEGEHDGVQFYERFKLKVDEEDGGWELRDGTKFGALAKARYGNGFFEGDQEFAEEDFDGFVFQAKVQPKKNLATGQIVGSTLNWETIMAVPTPKEKRKAKEAEQEKLAEAEAQEDADFEEIPF